jgi:hypothetical protein
MGCSFQKTPDWKKLPVQRGEVPEVPTSLEGEQVAMVEHYITKFVFCKEKKWQNAA